MRSPTRSDRPLVLCAGSMVQHGFVETIDAAAAAGFDGISVWKRTVRRAGKHDGLDLAAMRSMLDDRGLTVSEIEGTSAWLPGWKSSGSDDFDVDEGLELGTALGARSLLVYADEQARTHDEVVSAFQDTCDRASQFGLDVLIEFLPWSNVPDLASALRLVRDADRSNAKIAFDTWHHFRSGGTMPAGLAATDVGCIQLADGPLHPVDADPVRETMFHRSPPGEGDFEIDAQLTALGALGVACPIGVEVYHENLTSLEAPELAICLAEAARASLAAAGPDTVMSWI